MKKEMGRRTKIKK